MYGRAGIELLRARMLPLEPRSTKSDADPDNFNDRLARRQRGRRSAVSSTLRGGPERAELGRNDDEIDADRGLTPGLTQGAHAASPFASNRLSNRTELK